MRADVTLGILAGGRGERFGGRDKGWLEVDGRPQIERLLATLAPQVSRTIVSANRNLADYSALGVDVIADRWPDHPGPMAGVASLLAAAETSMLLTVPVDTIDVPADLVERMLACRGEEVFHAVVAEDDEGLQPLFALYPATLAAHAIETFEAGRRSVRDWQHRFPVYPCRFDGHRFGNINTPQDLPTP
jgi:molybdopterin-guanine dinucleotide biosynthesis protein A